MTYLLLFLEFFKIGLFAVGGGMATLPYLMELTERYDWYTASELANMIAISQSTPGPVGINMATYAGYQAGGIGGAILATFSLVLPALIIILIIAKFMEKVYENAIVQAAFYGIRPAIAAAIAFAVWGLCEITLFQESSNIFGITPIWISLIICLVCFALLQVKKLQQLHPIWWMVAGAVIGILFKL